MNKWCSNSDIN